MMTRKFIAAAREHQRRCVICREATVRLRLERRAGTPWRDLPRDGREAVAVFAESYYGTRRKS